MASTNYMTSSDLISAVKRTGMIPVSQKTFTDEDILAFANEEIDTGMLPDILTYFESYFLYKQNVPLVSNQSSYDIPYRAIGMKLQDVCYKDTSNNLYEMSRIQPDERVFFQGTQGYFTNNYRFYVENNSIVLTPGITTGAQGSLEMNFYMTPNELVLENLAAQCNNLLYSSSVTCSNVASGDIFYINDNIQLIAGIDFSATGTDAQTASALAAAITGFTTSVSSNILMITSTPRLTTVASATSLSSLDQVTLTFDSIPSNITEGSQIDMLQSRPGFKLYKYDFEVPANSLDMVAKTLIIDTDELPDQFLKTDYIASAGQAIIPQIPAELHPILVQRVVCRCLESLGDTQGLANAKAKLDDMISKMGNLIDNRVESAPQKIFNKGSPLRMSKFRQRNFFRL